MRKKRFFLIAILLIVMALGGLYKNNFSKYTLLEYHLAAKRWKAADEETSRVIVSVSGRRWTGSLADLLGWENTLKQFPCQDLHSIDYLWTKYSDGHFGLSIQQQIFQSLKVEDFDGDGFKLYDAFFDIVGWQYMMGQDNAAPNFDLGAPKGHLPSPSWMLKAGGVAKTAPWIENGVDLFQRIESCNFEA